jgi:regulator of sigma E protease
VTTTLLAFGIVLGIVILVHELGHFLVAKAVGIGVPRFSIGFGPLTPLRFKRGETEFVVSWIPLGGYVKMATREEEGGASAIEGGDAGSFPPEKLFENKPLWARALVLAAGVVMNVVLAWVIYSGLAATGRIGVDPVTTLAAVDTARMPAEAAALAQVPYGTQIVRINGDTIASWNDLQRAVIDPGVDRLRFDFAGDVPPVIVRIQGSRLDARQRLLLALEPLHSTRIAVVNAGSAAARARLQAGDVVVRVNADTVRHWQEMRRLLRPYADKPISLDIVRGDSLLTLPVTPGGQVERDLDGRTSRTVGFLGVGPEIPIMEVDLSFPQALAEGWARTLFAVKGVAATVKGLVLGQVSPKELGGPIAIGMVSGEAAREGLVTFLGLIAFISVNLAIFNLLPIPVLDGGHLLFLLAEGLLGRPVSTAVRLRLTQVGMILLLALVVLVMYNDVLRVFGIG